MPVSLFSIVLALTAHGAAATAPMPDRTPIVFLTPFLLHDIASTRQFDSGADGVAAEQGNDLCIRYPDGSIRNLSAEAGSAAAHVIRDPAVSWDGERVVFSMAIMDSAQVPPFFQLYEISGLREGATAVLRKVPGQPEYSDNTGPLYYSDQTLVFVATGADSGTAGVPGIWHLDAAARPEFLSFWSGDTFALHYDSAGSLHFLPRAGATLGHAVIERDLRR